MWTPAIMSSVPPHRPSKSRSRTRLLVSLIDPAECEVFEELAYPDFVDVKNPSRGSLGMPDLETIKEIRQRIPADVPLSVAIGDARNDPAYYASLALKAADVGADVVKVGLLDFRERGEVSSFLHRLEKSFDSASAGVQVVAAMYADIADKKEILDFPRIASDAGIKGCLLDTFRKNGGKLTHHLGVEELAEFIKRCGQYEVLSAIAGGFQIEDADWIIEAGPDVAGFRGAVAKNSRGKIGIETESLGKLLNLFGCRNTSAFIEGKRPG